MNKNSSFYTDIGVSDSATQEEVRSAYKKLSRKWHPDKWKDPKEKKQAELNFKKVSEAYDVLSDTQSRRRYDASRNVDAMEHGVFNGRSFFFSHPGNNDTQTRFNQFFQAAQQHQTRRQPSKGSPVTFDVPCTLEELYKGTKKSVKYMFRSGRESYAKELDVVVSPGWKEGTKLIYEEAAGVQDGFQQNSDVIVVIKEVPHQIFTRLGKDLVFVKKITLKEMLIGCKFTIVMINGSEKYIDWTHIDLYPDFEHRLVGGGMPIKQGGGLGDLVVKIEVDFSRDMLTPKQKTTLRNIFNESS
jgi:DnaJ family protein B protein 4